MIDWLAVYDAITDSCCYVPASVLGDGMRQLSLRLAPTKNGQELGIRYADDYRDPVTRQATFGVEPAGLEPAPSALQTPRSTN